MGTLMNETNRRTSEALLSLLQLASSALPVGAYSYSEGLEALVDATIVDHPNSLEHWLEQELRCGAIRLEAAVMLRSHQAAIAGDFNALSYWNAWSSAAKETEELRQQSWQMGRSLIRLLLEVQSPSKERLQAMADAVGHPCNFAIAFGITAAHWQIGSQDAILGYLQSWASNLISAGIKLIPIGQTAGQQLLLNLRTPLIETTREILTLEDDALSSCSWGLALASMAHETQYTRLFRS